MPIQTSLTSFATLRRRAASRLQPASSLVRTTALFALFGQSLLFCQSAPPANLQPSAEGQQAPRNPGAVAARNPQILAEQAQIEAAQRAIGATTVTIKGKEFPKRPEASGAKAQAFCDPYDTRQQNKVAELPDELPKGTNKSHSETFSSTYSPTLPVWVISSFQRIEGNRIGPVSVTVDAVPGGFHLLTSSQFQSEFSSTKNYVMNLNIADKVKADLTAKLEEYFKNYSSYSMEISASHGSVIHKAVLSGAGAFNGRTAYHGWIDTVEVCAPPEVSDLAGLKQRMKAWVDSTVKGLPARGVVFEPNLPKPVQ